MRIRHRTLSLIVSPILAIVLPLAAAPARAQQDRRVTVEAQGGYAGFLDDATIDHGVIGGSLKVGLTPRMRLGPEVVWMRGPGHDRDLFLTGTLTWDMRDPRPSPRVVPYLIAGGGVMLHRDRFLLESFSSWEGALTGGAGARIQVTPRLFVAPELRIGWEPHYRVGATIGYDLSM